MQPKHTTATPSPSTSVEAIDRAIARLHAARFWAMLGEQSCTNLAIMSAVQALAVS